MSLSELRNPDAALLPLNNFYVNGLSATNLTTTNFVAANISISGISPSLSILNTAGNDNGSVLNLQGGPSITSTSVKADNTGNLILSASNSSSNIELISPALLTGVSPSLSVVGPSASISVTTTSSQRPTILLKSNSFSPVVIYQDYTSGDCVIQCQNLNSNLDILTSGTGVVKLNGSRILYSSDGAVTQTGTIASPVTYNGLSCLITTVSTSLPSINTVTFILNNSTITANSIILVSIAGNDNSSAPTVCTNNTSDGSTRIVLFNPSSITMTNAFKIAVLIA